MGSWTIKKYYILSRQQIQSLQVDHLSEAYPRIPRQLRWSKFFSITMVVSKAQPAQVNRMFVIQS